jgi:26S proteasome regulatory subunit T2
MPPGASRPPGGDKGDKKDQKDEQKKYTPPAPKTIGKKKKKRGPEASTKLPDGNY